MQKHIDIHGKKVQKRIGIRGKKVQKTYKINVGAGLFSSCSSEASYR